MFFCLAFFFLRIWMILFDSISFHAVLSGTSEIYSVLDFLSLQVQHRGEYSRFCRVMLPICPFSRMAVILIYEKYNIEEVRWKVHANFPRNI